MLSLKFWGVRGSIPTPVQDNLGYGGNTTCMEVRFPGIPPLILDGGTGIRLLGLSLLREFPQGGDVNILFTHFHWDHIQGVPFFLPIFFPSWRLNFHSAREPDELEGILRGQMCAPYFPVAMPAALSVRTHSKVPADGFELGGLRIRPFPLNHPNGANGYRIDGGGHSIVLASDHEHGNEEIDHGIARTAAGADILIYDSQYTLEEYPSRRGWGHSTWEQAVRIAREAGVRQLVLFHHDPMHGDQAVNRIVEAARERFPNTIGAKEGWSVEF